MKLVPVIVTDGAGRTAASRADAGDRGGGRPGVGVLVGRAGRARAPGRW